MSAKELVLPISVADLQLEQDLLRAFERDVELAGLVGEKDNAKIILMAAASAKLPRPLNVSVGGASSAGKNHLIGTVAKFIPEESKKNLTGMSPKAMMHCEEDEFLHKAVFIAEYEGVSGADYAIRTMQSEQEIEWEIAETSKEGIKTRRKIVKGPAAFIQATTRATLHPENETRLMFVEMDESGSQTQAINKRQALEAEKRIEPCTPDVFAKWHQFFRSLKPHPVKIVFATQIAKSLPKDRIRSRRDFPKLLALIESSAFLHQDKRAKDDEGNIIASPQDYLIAKELFEHCYSAGPDTRIKELLVSAKQIRGEDFAVADLVRETGWGKTKVYAILNRAEELGCIAAGDKHGRYVLIREHVDAPLNLPPRIKLTAEDFRISNTTKVGDFQNSDFPLTEGGDSSSGKTEIHTELPA